jgi:hypothetical protein
VYVNVPKSTAEQTTLLEEVQGFRFSRDGDTRQPTEQREYPTARLEMAARKLADHKIMSRYLVGVQRLGKGYVSAPEVIHPYGRINKNHNAGERRRRGARNCGSVPANRAKRRALSLWMSASRASRKRALRSLTPLNV